MQAGSREAGSGTSMASIVGGTAMRAVDSEVESTNIEICRVLLDGPAGYQDSAGTATARPFGIEGIS